MTDASSDRNPVEALAEEFLDRFRRGQRPALSEYTRKYPELAAEIRDLFPALVERIRQNEVLATMDQRPYVQGRLAFRVLHQFLVEGTCPTCQVTLSPHLVMRGNLDYFLQRQSQDVRTERGGEEIIDAGDSARYAAG